jgi:hypothetical protein
MARTNSFCLDHYFTPPQQPYRAASLELDYSDPEVIASYIPTAKSIHALGLICNALEETSRDRAIGLIAPYGSGKTSLLLFLSALLENSTKTKVIRPDLLRRIERIAPPTARQVKRILADQKGYLVVPVSGSYGDIRPRLVQGLRNAFARHKLGSIWARLAARANPSHAEIVELYRAAGRELAKKGYEGVVLIYDEFGKVLESQQGEAKPEDLFLIQSLAEQCARSGRHRLALIVTLHQGFAQYAQRLPSHIRTEWAKIEGRFRIVHYVEDSVQVYELIAQALDKLHGKSFTRLKAAIGKLAKHSVKTSAQIPCFSGLDKGDERGRVFSAAFPLHPLALYGLPRLSARVSQNERTLFHFLLGNDSQCLSSLLTKKSVQGGKVECITIDDLFEYFSSLMASDTGVGGTYRRLIEIKAALERANQGDHLSIRVIKAIGLLSVLGERLQAPVTVDLLSFALESTHAKAKSELQRTLDGLVSKKILLYRRHSREYRIWEGSDVDLLSLIRQKKAEIETLLDLGTIVSEKIRAPMVFPHRYNEDFCITRAYEGQYTTVQDLKKWCAGNRGESCLHQIDGRILYILADSLPEVEDAEALAQTIADKQVLIAIPTKPLHLRDIAAETHCIEQLLREPAIINDDPIIRRELSEFADDCLLALRKVVDLFQNPRAGEIVWWNRGKAQPSIFDRVSLRRYLSRVCESVFAKTPRFNNEIINRRRPSRTVVNARKKVLRALLNHYGMKDIQLSGFGPDVSMFRSIYLNTGLYREESTGTWRFAAPKELKDENLREAMGAIHSFLMDAQDSPRPVKDIVEKLTLPPYGIREGVLPLVLAAGMKSFLLPVNLMEQGIYIKELKAETFEEMLIAGDRITVRCVPLPQHILEYLVQLQVEFSKNVSVGVQGNDPLRNTVESVYRWIHQQSPSCLASEQISQEARELRSILLKATDPVQLLFVDLPRITLKREIDSKPDRFWPTKPETTQVLLTVKGLRSEIEAVLSNYLAQVARITRKTFGLSEGDIEGLRNDLRKWVSSCESDLREYVEDPQCSGMLERIRSEYETDLKLVESLASLVTGRSVAHWDDSYLKQYELGLLSLYDRLLRTNALLAKRSNSGQSDKIKEYVSDPILWERLDVLSQEAKELLGIFLLNTKVDR